MHRRHVRAVWLAAMAAVGALLLALPPPAMAHGFAGQPYILPAPLTLYLLAGGAVVLLSFALVAAFVGGGKESASTVPVLALPALATAGVVGTARVVGGAIGVLGLLVIMVVGWLGPQTPPTANLAEYLVWIVFWAFLVIASGVVGNIWALVNPWAALYDLAAWSAGRKTPWPARAPYPKSWGWRPAIASYFAFAWFELASGVASHPALVATAAAVYTVYSLGMMGRYGRDVWLRNGDGFSVLFNLIGRFGPIEVQTGGGQCAACRSVCTAGQPVCVNCAECFRTATQRSVNLRPWAVGLLREPLAASWDRVLFIILTLSTLAFDGILATGPWNALLIATFPTNEAGQAVMRTIGLVGVTALFFSAYRLVVRLVRQFGGEQQETVRLAALFARTLVPIALVYNAAHNYTYVVLVGQGIIPLMSDPFGRGWNLFGTRAYRVTMAFSAASTVWYLQLFLIVLGHMIAVYLAHRQANQIYHRPQHALASQYPMLVLMVLYTIVSLWILAQPITQEA